MKNINLKRLKGPRLYILAMLLAVSAGIFLAVQRAYADNDGGDVQSWIGGAGLG
jgi:hypothetical protein